MLVMAGAYLYLLMLSFQTTTKDVRLFASATHWSYIPSASMLIMLGWSMDRYRDSYHQVYNNMFGMADDNHQDAIEVACLTFVLRHLRNYGGFGRQSIGLANNRLLMVIAGLLDIISVSIPTVTLVALGLSYVFPVYFAGYSGVLINVMLLALGNAVLNVTLYVSATMRSNNALDAWCVLFWLSQIVVMRSMELGMGEWMLNFDTSSVLMTASIGAMAQCGLILVGTVSASLLERVRLFRPRMQ
jgi:hypothetical protein